MALFLNRKKRNSHAEDFKTAYENGDMSKIQMVLSDWLNNGITDGLFGLAMTILVSIRKDKSLREAMYIYKSSVKRGSEYDNLFDWFETTALTLMADWNIEKLSEDPFFKDKLIEKKIDGKDSLKEGTFINPPKDDIPNADFKDLTCKDFSKTFKSLYEGLVDADFDNMVKLMDKINELLAIWREKCPDDSHLPAAYAMTNGPRLTKDDLSECVYKFASGKVYDDSLHEWFEDGLVLVIKITEKM